MGIGFISKACRHGQPPCNRQCQIQRSDHHREKQQQTCCHAAQTTPQLGCHLCRILRRLIDPVIGKALFRLSRLLRLFRIKGVQIGSELYFCLPGGQVDGSQPGRCLFLLRRLGLTTLCSSSPGRRSAIALLVLFGRFGRCFSGRRHFPLGKGCKVQRFRLGLFRHFGAFFGLLCHLLHRRELHGDLSRVGLSFGNRDSIVFFFDLGNGGKNGVVHRAALLHRLLLLLLTLTHFGFKSRLLCAHFRFGQRSILLRSRFPGRLRRRRHNCRLFGLFDSGRFLELGQNIFQQITLFGICHRNAPFYKIRIGENQPR